MFSVSLKFSYTPNDIPIYYYRSKRVDSCINETVTFINDGLCPIYVSWIPNEHTGRASVQVEPESFEVSEGHTEVDVRISPKFSGQLRDILRFRTESLDGNISEATVYVRGIVESTPEVNFRPAIAPFGSYCAGTLESYRVHFDVKSPRIFDIYRRLYELDDHENLNLLNNVQSFGRYETESMGETTLKFETPLKTEVNRIKIIFRLGSETRKRI